MTSCGLYRRVNLLERFLKIVENVLEKQILAMISLNRIQLGFMPGQGAVNAILSMGRVHE